MEAICRSEKSVAEDEEESDGEEVTAAAADTEDVEASVVAIKPLPASLLKGAKKGKKKFEVTSEDPEEIEDREITPQEEGADLFDSVEVATDSKENAPPDFVLQEDIAAELHAAVKQIEAKKKMQNKKIYERKASESLYSEELEFHQFRKKKL